MQAVGQALAIQLQFTAEGDLQVRMPLRIDQFDAQPGLSHLPGLAHTTVVEADELRRFGGITQGELFRVPQMLAQILHQCLEVFHLTQ